MASSTLDRIEALARAIREDAGLAAAELMDHYGIDAPAYVGRIEANAKTIGDLADTVRRDLRSLAGVFDRLADRIEAGK